jgi:hypothetical protein
VIFFRCSLSADVVSNLISDILSLFTLGRHCFQFHQWYSFIVHSRQTLFLIPSVVFFRCSLSADVVSNLISDILSLFTLGRCCFQFNQWYSFVVHSRQTLFPIPSVPFFRYSFSSDIVSTSSILQPYHFLCIQYIQFLIDIFPCIDRGSVLTFGRCWTNIGPH